MRIDPASERVLDHERGALLVTGPPGSGKTTLLRERFARLVRSGADPERITLFTLNRRAAREGREDLVRRMGRSLPELPVFTAHSFAFRVVGRHYASLGYEEPPPVLSAPEQYAVVRELLQGERVADWPRFGELLSVRGFARQVADFVLRAQERLLAPEDLDRLVEASGRRAYREVAAFYARYLDTLTDRVDFAGLLFQTASLLSRGVPDEERFEHVLVDDYQDATHATEAIVRALAEPATSTVIAADPAGHVFSYRGGTLEPLERAPDALAPLERVYLVTSHRIDPAALAPLETPAPPAAAPPSPGNVEARLFVHPGEEVEAVAHELLRSRVDDDVPWARMLVVVRRYGSYLTALRHTLARHGIPFVVVAEASAVATEPANRPVIDVLRYVFRPDQRDDLLEGILTSPVVGLDPHALRALRREARRRGRSLRELVQDRGEAVDGDLGVVVERFRTMLEALPAMAHQPDQAFFWIWTQVPHFARLVADGVRHRDLDALSALAGVLSRFVERRPGASVVDYLDTIETAEFGPDPWVPPEERRPHTVRVVSAHRAQGVEADVVLVAGCLEGEFPSLSHGYPMLDLDTVTRRMAPRERLAARLAEERALFRLAISRATRRTVLFASHSASASNPRAPSRFAARIGLQWRPPVTAEPHAASLRSMEASLRRRLADPAVAPAERLAAVAALPAVDARPEAWWGAREWSDPGLPLHAGELRTSYSRLSTLQNCALQYLYQSELGLDPESTHHMWLGGVIHGIIDRVHKGELTRDLDVLLAALDEAWEPERFPYRALEHQRHRDAEQMLANWLRGEGNDPLVSEVRFEFPIDGAVMRGVIDAVFRTESGHLRLIDYKTGRYPPTNEQVRQDLQLATYYLALLETEELRALGEPRMLELHFIGVKRYNEAYSQPRVAPRMIDGYAEWARATVRDLLGRVRSEDFSPSPEADCQFCRFKPICPRWPQGGEVPL